jgi:taurine dioxygenase
MGRVETISVEPLTAAIGARVDGVDLRAPLDDEQRDAIHAALLQHLVLFFRDQDLTEEQQLAFASRFGPPVPANPDPRPGADPMYFVSLEDTAESPPKADRWHTDIPFVPRPPDVAVLSMRDTPAVGGDTLWASLYAVYEGLSPAMQDLLADLDLELDLGTSRQTIRDLYGEARQTAATETFRGVTHPLVRVHPDTGRPALYLCGSFMHGIAGMHPEESDALLGFLSSRLDDPNVQCRWRWRANDVAMWDERCTNHRALSDHYPNRRFIRRCLAGQGVPMRLGAAGRARAAS